MHWAVRRLTSILEPPETGGDAIDWHQVIDDYGVVFPADYRSFVETYGGGFLDDYIDVFTPPVDGSVYGQILADIPFTSGLRHPYGFPLYPDAGGLFRWAASSSGDDAFWHCVNDNPDQWTVLVCTRQISNPEDRWTAFNGGMVEFLLEIIQGNLPSPFSDPSHPSLGSVFTNWRNEN